MKRDLQIYFDNTTGEVIQEVDGDIVSSNVKPTSQDEAFLIYVKLRDRTKESISVKIVPYDEIDWVKKAQYLYHIDPISLEIVWDLSIALSATLDDAKTFKLEQIQNFYNQRLTDGFTSLATGTPYTFGYGQTDREKFMQLAISVLSNIETFPTPIPAKDGTIVFHDRAQYDQLLADIKNFGWVNQNRLHELSTQVQTCTTVDEVNAIVVSF